MLSDNKIRILQLAIIDYLHDPGGQLSALVGAEVVGELVPHARAGKQALAITERAIKDVELLRRILNCLDPIEVNDELQPIRISIQNWTPLPSSAPFSALNMRDGSPFVDRDNVRHKLRELLGPGNRQVLLVNGETGFGKSYSAKMIAEEAAQRTNFRVAYLTVEPSSASIWGVNDVATEIVRPLPGVPNRLPTHVANSDRLAGLLADWTAEEIRRSGDTLWVMLDGFGHQDIPRETSNYIDELLALAPTDRRMDRVRVILFDFDASRLASLTDDYISVALHLPRDAEVKKYFETKFPDLSPAYWDAAATIAIEGLPSDGPACMPKLQLNIKRANDELYKVT